MLRGEIWLCNSTPSVGDEIRKIRPAVIVNNNEVGTLRLKVVVPITGWSNDFADVPWMVRIIGLVDQLSQLSPMKQCLGQRYSSRTNQPATELPRILL
jgi:mRNA-degrading endonuclease toxin of MazEF toxin-antitoxin module